MTDENLVEAMARAICWSNVDYPEGEHWRLYVDDATAALAAYRQCTQEDGK